MLTKKDRCDRCGAAAAHLYRRGENEQLLFCGHHANDHHEALDAQGFVNAEALVSS